MVRKLKVIIAFGGFGVSRLRSRSAVGGRHSRASGGSSCGGLRLLRLRKRLTRSRRDRFRGRAIEQRNHLNKVIDDGGTRSDTASTTGSGLCERGGHVPLRWSLLALLSSLGPILGFQEASMNAMWRDRLLGRP